MAQIDYFKDVLIICVTILPVERYRRDEIKIADLENGIKRALYHLFYSVIHGSCNHFFRYQGQSFESHTEVWLCELAE